MKGDKILVVGACGQIGTDLTAALRRQHGNSNIIAADIRPADDSIRLDVTNRSELHQIVVTEKITQIYLLAAMLSANGEKNPQGAWNLNIQSLLNVLSIAKIEKIDKVFWPSSIAVFGPSSPKGLCPQSTIMDPSTVYGISKLAGEQWCQYYFSQYGVDVRSIRLPGLVGYGSSPSGGTTDWAVDIFHQALEHCCYQCFLREDSILPMMYMPDAINGILRLMEAPKANLTIRTSYNLAAMSFSPKELIKEIKKHIPGFMVIYEPDARQSIADSWPHSIDDSVASHDWDWDSSYGLGDMVKDMLFNLAKKRERPPEWLMKI